ncbi:MAG: hypothetical protein ACRD0N_01765, partial [Acidimicrobiales bacterium]
MNGILLDILLVLVAAKLAAEVAERMGVPAVVGEILAAGTQPGQRSHQREAPSYGRLGGLGQLAGGTPAMVKVSEVE